METKIPLPLIENVLDRMSTQFTRPRPRTMVPTGSGPCPTAIGTHTGDDGKLLQYI